MTPDDLITIIVDNAKSKQWLSSTFQITTERGTFGVGVKAYGRWVQRIECCGLCDGTSSGHKTNKAFRADVSDLLNRILSQA